MGLIDAAKAIESIDEIACSMSVCINTDYCHGMTAMKDAAIHAVERQPTVDAVPVVHAYWIIKPHGTYGQLRAFCSACGKHSGIGGIVSNQKKPYCPNCGAIMDGKEIVDG